MKITVMGLGSVALADALALARVHRVVLTGPAGPRLDAIAAGQYPLADPALDGYLQAHRLSLSVEPAAARALQGADFVLVAAPLPIDLESGKLMTGELDAAIASAVKLAPQAVIVVRSAVPVGFTEARQRAHPQASIVVAPEFSEPETPLSSVLAPSLILVGERGSIGQAVSSMLADAALTQGAARRHTGATEAEAARHLSLIMQAARIVYFNELDSYALAMGINAGSIIDGVCLDPRIGDHQANPGFGPGGPLLALAESAVRELAGELPLPVLLTIARAREVRLGFLQDRTRAAHPRRVHFESSRSSSSPQASA